MKRTEHIDWPGVLKKAAAIVESYDTAVTLRQLFYRLVAAGLIRNTEQAYKGLSRVTAEARRVGGFPQLADAGRTIHRYTSWANPQELLRAAAEHYRRDRTEGQAALIYLIVEKNTLVAQLQSWFGDLGLPILALRGYSSESYEREIANDVDTSAGGRPVVMLYAGDFDPTGEDIDRNFKAQMERRGLELAETVRVALSNDQVQEYNLPEAPGKSSDSRANGFHARHGKLVQVELEALDPAQLHQLYQDAIDRYWDTSAHEAVLALEEIERGELMALVKT